jgi:hypothetical protein
LTLSFAPQKRYLSAPAGLDQPLYLHGLLGLHGSILANSCNHDFLHASGSSVHAIAIPGLPPPGDSKGFGANGVERLVFSL